MAVDVIAIAASEVKEMTFTGTLRAAAKCSLKLYKETVQGSF